MTMINVSLSVPDDDWVWMYSCSGLRTKVFRSIRVFFICLQSCTLYIAYINIQLFVKYCRPNVSTTIIQYSLIACRMRIKCTIQCCLHDKLPHLCVIVVCVKRYTVPCVHRLRVYFERTNGHTIIHSGEN